MAKQNRLPIQIEDLHLTVKETEFVLAYTTNGYNSEKAWKDSKLKKQGQTDIEAHLEASALLNKREIRIAVQRMVASVLDPARDRIEAQLLQSDMIRASYDIADYFYDDGTVKPLSELTYEQRLVIDNVETQYFGKSADIKVLKYLLANREQAKKNLRTSLKIADGDSGKEEVPDSARSRVQDIFKAGLLGLKEGEKRARAETKQANSTAISTEVEVVEEAPLPEDIPVEPSYILPIRQEIVEEEIIEAEVEKAPMISRAKKILGGMNLPPDHPLFQRGREIAAAKIKEKMDKEK